MTSEIKNWIVVGFNRPRVDASDNPVQRGAKVIDQSTLVTYSATIDRLNDKPSLTFLSIERPNNETITAQFLTDIPVDQIVIAVAAYLDATDEADDVIPGDERKRGDMPDLGELTKKLRSTATIKETAVEYGVSVPTLYRWRDRAIEEGHEIRRRRGGRKKKSSSTPTHPKEQ